MTLSSVSPESHRDAVASPADGACQRNQTDRRAVPPNPVEWFGSPVSMVALMLLETTVSVVPVSTSAFAKASLAGMLGRREEVELVRAVDRAVVGVPVGDDDPVRRAGDRSERDLARAEDGPAAVVVPRAGHHCQPVHRGARVDHHDAVGSVGRVAERDRSLAHASRRLPAEPDRAGRDAVGPVGVVRLSGLKRDVRLGVVAGMGRGRARQHDRTGERVVRGWRR